MKEMKSTEGGSNICDFDNPYKLTQQFITAKVLNLTDSHGKNLKGTFGYIVNCRVFNGISMSKRQKTCKRRNGYCWISLLAGRCFA